MTPPSTESGVGDGPMPHVAVITMARDEQAMLPRWIDYYARQVGVENLVVLDDNTVDGSTKDLPCTTFRLPPASGRQKFDKTRLQLINAMARGLLAYFDVVIYTDVDEFLVPDPGRYDGLLHYLATRADRKVIAPVGLNVLHNPRVEPELDPTQPLLAQRRFVKFAPGMCKPVLKRIPSPWLPAFHAIKAPFEIDRELWLLHLKYHDLTALRETATHRNLLHTTEGRGSVRSAWTLSADELTTRLLTWVESPDGPATPELDPAELDLSNIVQRTESSSYRSTGFQLQAMTDSPLRQLPQRFRHAF